MFRMSLSSATANWIEENCPEIRQFHLKMDVFSYHKDKFLKPQNIENNQILCLGVCEEPRSRSITRYAQAYFACN